jgi:hypothetical protein
VELELRDEAVEALPVGGAGIDRDAHPAGDHVDRSGLDIDHAHRGDRSVHGRRDVTYMQHVLGRRHQRIQAVVHWNGARVPDVPLEGALAADDADDPHRKSQRGARPLQHGTLLDVHLEKALRQLAALDAGGAADATALFVAEHDHRARADTLDRLDRGDDPERTVELPSKRHRIQVRAGPDARLRRASDEIPRLVDLDLEPGLPHPSGGQLVRPVFAWGAANTVCADTTADGVELVEPLVNPHVAIIPPGRDAIGRVPVPGTGTTL